jgi:hypothetical protein
MSPQIANYRTTGRWSHARLAIVGVVLLSPAVSAQGPGSSSQRAASADSTRIVPLYYAENVDAVMALVRGCGSVANADAEKARLALEQIAAEARRLADRNSELRSENPTAAQQAERRANDDKLRSLAEQERDWRATVFPDTMRSGRQAATSLTGAGCSVDQVQMGLAGVGRIHLRGPLEQVNAVTRMLHEIDQPVGQVRVGIHVLQMSASDDKSIDGMNVAVNALLQHARFMTRESQQMFRVAFRTVVSRLHAENPGGFAEAFFYDSVLKNFRALYGGKGRQISVEAFDSRDIVSTLFLTAIANAGARQEILSEFHQLTERVLPEFHKQYRETLAKSQRKPEGGRFRWFSGDNKDAAAEQYASDTPDFSFARITAYLQSLGSDDLTANSVQVAVLRSQRAQLELRSIQMDINKMREQRILLAASRESEYGLVDRGTFSQLTDQIINQKQHRALDIQEAMRGESATLDGHLRHLSEAFEEDVRRQFYQPALEDLRQLASRWKVQMGQMQTTTIVTNDRTRARVSPEQVAVMDMAKRKILLQEGLELADGLVKEAGVISQRIAATSASEILAPGTSALLDSTGLAPVPGKHLESLTTASQRTRVSVGDEIDFTPVIQPDGATVAFHLQYAHAPRRHSDDSSESTAGLGKHYIDTQVQVQNHELKEVSRFRSEMNATEQGRGVMLLEDVPVVGTLFRPRRASAATIQQSIILTDVVIYPTSAAMGRGWLAMESAEPDSETGDPRSAKDPVNLVQWVEQTLEASAQAALQGDGRTRVAKRLGQEQTADPPRRLQR